MTQAPDGSLAAARSDEAVLADGSAKAEATVKAAAALEPQDGLESTGKMSNNDRNDAVVDLDTDSPSEDSGNGGQEGVVTIQASGQTLANAGEAAAQIVTEMVVLNSETTWLEMPAFSDAGDVTVAGQRPQIKSLVILFGWAGSSQRLVSKYRDLYYTLLPSKCTAVCTHLAANAAATFSHDFLNTLFKPVVDTLVAEFPSIFDLSQPDPPPDAPQPPNLIIHAFSNGGSHQLHHFFRSLRLRYPNPKRHLPLSSLIIDSAPGSRSVRGFAQFLLITLRLRRTVLALAFCTVIAATLTAVMRVSRGIWSLIFGRQRDGYKYGVRDDLMDEIAETLGNGPRRAVPGLGGSEWTERCGKLLIYSETDLLIDHRHVHSYADALRLKYAEREERGEDLGRHGWVEEMKFLDTEHVRHFQAYPDAYRDRLRSFLQRCGVECIGNFSPGLVKKSG